jgi:hypothetical protein
MMETFWFWFMKPVAEVAFGIIAAFVVFFILCLWLLFDAYIKVPYTEYKERKRWMSKDFDWVADMYRYHDARKYHAYSDWRPWMQEVYDLKKKEFEDGKR